MTRYVPRKERLRLEHKRRNRERMQFICIWIGGVLLTAIGALIVLLAMSL